MRIIPLLLAVLVTGCAARPKSTNPREFVERANRTALAETINRGPANEQERRLGERIDVLFASSPGYRSQKNDIGKSICLPKLLKMRRPLYPVWARIHQISARVILASRIDGAGRIREVKVVSSTDERFNNAAIEAVSKWKYSGGTMEGKPQEFVLVAPVSFLAQ